MYKVDELNINEYKKVDVYIEDDLIILKPNEGGGIIVDGNPVIIAGYLLALDVPDGIYCKSRRFECRKIDE